MRFSNAKVLLYCFFLLSHFPRLESFMGGKASKQKAPSVGEIKVDMKCDINGGAAIEAEGGESASTAPSQRRKKGKPVLRPKPLKLWERSDPEARVLNRKHKWLGGAVGEDGAVYGIPSHAEGVIKIIPDTGEITVLPGPSLGNQGFKWLRGVVVPEDEGAIYGIPASASSVLRISTKDGTVSTHGEFPGAPWNWHGAALASDGNIYAIPSCAEQVLKLDPRTKEVTMIGPKMEGRNKFYGGIVGNNGKIYGIPYRSDGVLEIDPATQEVKKLGKLPSGFIENWHGGAKSPINGCIYGFPANAESVLCITPETGEVKELRPEDGKALEGRYKWLGGSVSREGNVYCVPSDSTVVLKIEPATNRITTFGDVPATINKWQGGVLGPPGDDKIYCIPSDADTVLVIDPCNNDSISYLGEGVIPKGIKDKWQGGFLVGDIIYAIPENADTLLKLYTKSQHIELVPLKEAFNGTYRAPPMQ